MDTEERQQLVKTSEEGIGAIERYRRIRKDIIGEIQIRTDTIGRHREIGTGMVEGHRGKMAGAIGEHSGKEPARYDVTEEKCRHIRKIQTNKDMIGQRGVRTCAKRGHGARKEDTSRRHRRKV